MKSQPNIISDPSKPLPIIKIRFILSCSPDAILRELAKVSDLSWASYQSITFSLKYPSTEEQTLMANRMPLISIQSMTSQL